MNKLVFGIILSLAIFVNSLAQQDALVPPPPCYANGNSGFGGAVGLNDLMIVQPLDLNKLVFSFTLYNGGYFDDILVIYIDAGTPGRSVIDDTIEDATDGYTIAITNSNVFRLGSVITFPNGFQATHAFAMDDTFGGLWSIPNSGIVGTGGLNFITSVNTTISPNYEDPYFWIEFDWADLGLSFGDEFYFLGLYVSETGATSDEGYGDGITPGTNGADPVTYTGFRSIYDCNETLSSENLADESFSVLYDKGNLTIQGLNGEVTVTVFDLMGRTIYKGSHNVYGNKSIPLELRKKQIQFIEVESISHREVLKVIPF